MRATTRSRKKFAGAVTHWRLGLIQQQMVRQRRKTLINETLTISQAVRILRRFAITDDAGTIPGSVHVLSGNDVVATMIVQTDPFFAESLIEKAHTAQVWRYASKGTSGCIEDGLDVTVNDTWFTFRLKPVTEIPAAG